MFGGPTPQRARRIAHGDERGQILIMSAFAFVVIMGFGALAIDLGFFARAKTDLQADADAMALAGAQELPDQVQADLVARQWAVKNSVDTTEIVSITFNAPSCRTPAPSGDIITVRLAREQPTYLGRVLGVTEGTVEACATATLTSGGAGYAIFANNGSCGISDTLEISGSSSYVEGAVHSNGTLKVNGSSNDFDGETSYTCALDVSGSGNTFDPPTTQQSNQPLPVNYAYSDFPCTMTFTSDTDLSSVSSAWQGGSPSSGVLNPGVYCSTQKLTLSGSNVTGNVTLAAQGEVNVAGSNFNLTAYWNDVLMYTSSTSSSALDVSGSGGQWTGILLAPNGLAKVQGSSNLSLSGSIIADLVKMSGSSWSLTSLDSGGGDPYIRLVE